jgi:iron complex outermembrane receptor protein
MNYNTPPVINSFYKNIVVSNNSRIEFNFQKNSYAFGAEILYGTLNSNELKSNIDRKHYAVFNSNKIEWKNLLVYPSLRYDYITDIKKGAVTYRLGFNYSGLLEGNLFIKGNVSRNFCVPTFNALYWKQGGNPNLKPEYSQNYEAGIIYTGKFFVNYAFDFNYLNIILEDRIVWLPGRNFIWSPVNIGKAKSEIIISSLRINYPVTKQIIVRGEVSYTNNSSKKTNEDFPGDPSVNKQILYIPDEQIKSNLELNFGNYGVNLFHSYIGKRYSDTENLYPLSPINILDGNIFFDYRISKYTASLKFEINNITNSDYQIVAGYPAPLRNFNFKINLNYSL